MTYDSIIIARGGSRRLPRKNVMPFNGIPLFVWSVIHAKAARSIRNVYVSTDDDEIENLSHRYGADTVRRPEWKNPDDLSANVPYRHAMKFLDENLSVKPDAYVTMIPTSVLRKPDDIDRLIQDYENMIMKHGDQVLTVLARCKETVFMEIDGDFAYPRIHNKYWDYAAPCLGINVTSTKAYYDFSDRYGCESDSEFDRQHRHDTSEEYMNARHYVAFAEEWQIPDIDHETDFRVCEALQREFIIGQNSVTPYKVFEDYAGGSIVPEQKELPL